MPPRDDVFPLVPHDIADSGLRRETRSTCPYCGVGCGVIIESNGDAITGVRGDPDHPANGGRLCTKGSTLHLTARREVNDAVRLLRPMLRTERDAERTAVNWDTALDHVARRFADTVARHGPDSVGVYISGQLLTEDYYVFNKFAKGLLGTNNIDSNSRLCMSSAVTGYKLTLGADAPPACYEDIGHADLIFIAGSNTAWAHPILFRRIEDARRRNPSLQIIVVDPRCTDTARVADQHLQILPGTDVALFHGMLHVLLWEGLVDEAYIAAHTNGFDALKALVREYTPHRVAEICGIREDELQRAALAFGRSRAVLSLYCQGLNQSTSGTAKNAALINLHLATGQIGKPGAGPFSLTGQPNAMGGREVGGMANLMSAHRDLADPEQRAEVARLWGVDSVPATPGKTAVEMFEAARTGAIKALWIVCTNPAQSLPNQALVREALCKAEFVVVQEAYATTATAAFADLLLPASTWGEKEGTVTNSERRISRVRAAVAAPGEAWADWEIAAEVARRIERLRQAPRTLFPYANAEEVWNEHRESTRGRDLDITGLDYTRLESAPQQWPCPEGEAAGRARLYEEGRFATPDGRARFAAVPYAPVAEPVDARFPFRMTTGRLRDHWHGMSRTGTLGRLFAHGGEPCVQLHPTDLARRGFADGDLVHVTSRRGSQVLPIAASADVRCGEAFIAMHWGNEFVAGSGDARATGYGVNGLTHDAVDPKSFQPELKHAAVKILRAELPWRYVVFGWFAPGEALRVQHALRARFGHFGYAASMVFGNERTDGDLRTGVLFRGAAQAPVDASVLRLIEGVFALDGSTALRYDDARRAVRRRMRLDEGVLQAVSLAGDIAAEGWLREFLEAGRNVTALGRALLMPSREAPAGYRPRGRIVCNCFNVGVGEIDTFIDASKLEGDALFSALQGKLRCGTSCGSCVPELRARLQERRLASAQTA